MKHLSTWRQDSVNTTLQSKYSSLSTNQPSPQTMQTVRTETIHINFCFKFLIVFWNQYRWEISIYVKIFLVQCGSMSGMGLEATVRSHIQGVRAGAAGRGRGEEGGRGVLYSEVQCIMGNGHMGIPREQTCLDKTENITPL